MAEFIRQREYVEYFTFSHEYEYRGGTGAGFSFSCNEDGSLLEDMTEKGKENYRKCQDGTHDVVYLGIKNRSHHYWEPAVIECRCGAEIELHDSWLNTCDDCGCDFNGSGQELAPREQWGEETGEHYTDLTVGGHDW